MTCVDCKASPPLCAAHHATSNHDPEVDYELMVIDLRREVEMLTAARNFCLSQQSEWMDKATEWKSRAEEYRREREEERDRVEHVTRQRDALRAALETAEKKLSDACERGERATRETWRALAALWKYGKHGFGCSLALGAIVPYAGRGPCTCGLAEALGNGGGACKHENVVPTKHHPDGSIDGTCTGCGDSTFPIRDVPHERFMEEQERNGDLPCAWHKRAQAILDGMTKPRDAYAEGWERIFGKRGGK